MHILLGILAFTGLATAGVSFAAWRGTHGRVALVLLLAGLALAIWAFRALWRLDAYAAAQFGMFCFALPALVSALWAFNVSESIAGWTLTGVFLVAGGSIAWGGGWSMSIPPAAPIEGSDLDLPPDRWTISWQPAGGSAESS